MSAEQLYNDAIIALARAAHRSGRLPEPRRSATCDNPLCGDRIAIDAVLADGAIRDLAQKTRGCLLTQAAASLIGQHADGLTSADAHRLLTATERILAGEPAEGAWPELAIFAPVASIKSRHECVLLPFQALRDVLAQAD